MKTQHHEYPNIAAPPRAVPKMAFRIDEAVFASGISRSGLYRAIDEKRLESVKIGGRRLIPHAALEAFLAGELA